MFRVSGFPASANLAIINPFWITIPYLVNSHYAISTAPILDPPIAFSWNAEHWTISILITAQDPGSNYYLSRIYPCAYSATTLCTALPTVDLDLSFISPGNAIQSTAIAYTSNNDIAVALSEIYNQADPGAVGFYIDYCSTSCAPYQLTRPVESGLPDHSLKVLYLDESSVFAWQRGNEISGTYGSLMLHYPWVGTTILPRPEAAGATGPAYEVDTNGSLIAAIWTQRDPLPAGTWSTYLVYNAEQTRLPVAIR